MMARHLYTHDELRRISHQIDRHLQATETEYPTARGVPPLTVAECLEHLDGLIDLAGVRVLTREEQFLTGQLHNQLRQAVRAEMLGYKGRYYVVDEETIARLTKDDE